MRISKQAIERYKESIQDIEKSGIAREESYYPALEELLQDYFDGAEYKVVSSPKDGKDKPDLLVVKNSRKILAIEAKLPGKLKKEYIRANTNSRLFDQIYRYRGEDANISVLVTDFKEFWVIDKESSNSKEKDHIVKDSFNVIDQTSVVNSKRKLEEALYYLCGNLQYSINKLSEMIPRLVDYAKEPKQVITDLFAGKVVDKTMKEYLESMREALLATIFATEREEKSKEFADFFAQTLVYGTFTAWMEYSKNNKEARDFRFSEVKEYLRHGSFTFNMFNLNDNSLTRHIRENVIGRLEHVFQISNYKKIINQKGEDIETLMITFYSDFLKEYDPDLSSRRGVVYTPQPIVNFMIRGLDHFLQKYFDEPDGVISDNANIQYLDPAAGTMTYSCELLRLAYTKFTGEGKGQKGLAKMQFRKWVDNFFRRNVFSFEIMMAPYILGLLRTRMLLEDLGWKDNNDDEPITQAFLFNSLMDDEGKKLEEFDIRAIKSELKRAFAVRNNKKIQIVMGNPPYNKSSQNNSTWIEKKVKVYHNNIRRPGRKPSRSRAALNDDYVKFIRLAQWKIAEKGYGIVSFITNNSYLDGLTFRGMRYSLMEDFDKIYIINLHGDIRKRTTIPNDENIFADKTQVGVAIVFLIKMPHEKKKL